MEVSESQEKYVYGYVKRNLDLNLSDYNIDNNLYRDV